MVATKLSAAALFSLVMVAPAAAQDLSWGCSFDRYSGRTVCLEVAGDPPRNTGNLLVSKPNVGIPGRYYSDDGRTVRVYLGHNGTGKQKFHWQK